MGRRAAMTLVESPPRSQPAPPSPWRFSPLSVVLKETPQVGSTVAGAIVGGIVSFAIVYFG